MVSQGGERVKVREVTMLDVQPRRRLPDGGFIAECRWDVSGSVGHWGHVHGRSNRYQAELAIAPVDGSWKLIGLEILDEQRL